MTRRLDLRVSCDTPLGVEFATLRSSGKGVLVVERICAAFAVARGWKPEECELLVIEDASTGRPMWTHDDGAAAPGGESA